MLIATIVGSSMVFIDGTAVNVILPVLQSDLGATAVQLQWVVVGYTLFLSSLMLVGGSLGDHYGRVRMFIAGTIVFTLASIGCGLAPNAAALVFARCVQGVGSALLTPGSLALIGANFDERQRGQAIGTWSSFTAVMAALGPGLGGWLAQHASWRWVFFINVPLAVLVVIVALRCVPESNDRERVHHVDWLGAAACTVGLGALVYGLTFSSTEWVIVGLAALIGFVWIESRSPAPLVPLELFKSKDFSGVNALTLLLYGGLSGAMFFLPFEMIQIDGYSPTAAGFTFLPFIVLMFFLSPVAGGLMRTVGARLLLVIGPLVTGAGFVFIGLAGGHANFVTGYLPAILTIGLGMSITVAPLTTTAMETVSSERMGTASGVNNAVSRVAGMIAIAAIGALVLTTFSTRLGRELVSGGVSPGVAAAVMRDTSALAQTTAPPGAAVGTQVHIRDAVRSAYLDAFRLAMDLCAGLTAAGALIAALTISPRPVAAAQNAPTPAPIPEIPR